MGFYICKSPYKLCPGEAAEHAQSPPGSLQPPPKVTTAHTSSLLTQFCPVLIFAEMESYRKDHEICPDCDQQCCVLFPYCVGVHCLTAPRLCIHSPGDGQWGGGPPFHCVHQAAEKVLVLVCGMRAATGCTFASGGCWLTALSPYLRELNFRLGFLTQEPGSLLKGPQGVGQVQGSPAPTGH